MRVRHPKRYLAITLLLLAVAAVAVVYFANRTEKGPGDDPIVAQPPGLEPVELGRQAASQYDPEGDDGEESPEAENLVLDGLRNTGWDTETYQAGFEGAGKSGVGIYVDAGEPIPGRRLALITSTPAAVQGRRLRRQHHPDCSAGLDEGQRGENGEPRASGVPARAAPQPALPVLPGLDLEPAGVGQGHDPGDTVPRCIALSQAH